MANWDDVRFVLALARTGTIRGAAKSLAVNHTTVSRRISALEKQLAARLFEQTPQGYVTTASGKIISQAAAEIEDLLVGSQQRIEGSDTELSGDVHIHIPDIFDEWVCERLGLFSRQHPQLKIHLSSDVSVVDLARREADIALRFTDSPPEDMVGKKVWQLSVALYCAIDFEFDAAKSLASYPWVRWAAEFGQSRLELWTEKVSAGTETVTRVNTYKTLTGMIKNGAGIGYLSPWFAENDPDLKRLTPVIDNLAMDVWVLIHPDLRGVKRISAIKELLIDLFETKDNFHVSDIGK